MGKSQESGLDNEKIGAYRKYLRYHKYSPFFAIFQSFQNQLSFLITYLKGKYVQRSQKNNQTRTPVLKYVGQYLKDS